MVNNDDSDHNLTDFRHDLRRFMGYFWDHNHKNGEKRSHLNTLINTSYLGGVKKMVQANFTSDMVEKAEKNFENIKESVKGLYDILNIGIEDEIYLEAGKDNISGLYKNIIELLLNDYGLRKLVKKIRSSELEVDIVLDELLVENDL